MPEGAVADRGHRWPQAGDHDPRRPRATRLNPVLYLAQRGTAFVLAFAVTVHLVTIIYAVHSGLSAAAILDRTHGNVAFLGFYLLFVVAAAIHAPIGLRSILREWLRWRGPSLDIAMVAFAALLFALGTRAALAVYVA